MLVDELVTLLASTTRRRLAVGAPKWFGGTACDPISQLDSHRGLRLDNGTVVAQVPIRFGERGMPNEEAIGA